MSKIIPEQKINSCCMCPYRIEGTCTKLDRILDIAYIESIPSWCPLPDYKEPVQPCTDWGHDVDKYYKEPQVENPYPDKEYFSKDNWQCNPFIVFRQGYEAGRKANIVELLRDKEFVNELKKIQGEVNEVGFRILTEHTLKNVGHLNGKKPSELTPSERIELIKQLCGDIDKVAGDWYFVVEHKVIEFTDYLAEQMEKR